MVYVDESGDEGFSFGQGSSDWFVLSAAVTRKPKDLDTVKLVDTVRAHLKKPDKKPLHFRDLRHEHRLVFVDAISHAALKTVIVLAHKPSLKEPEKFQERYRLYYYSVRYLLERVSWFCRDHRPPHDAGDGSAEIVSSNRSGMSYADLREYMAKLKRQGMDKSGWGCINRDVKQQPSVLAERMVLRPLLAKDAPVVQRLARSRKVAYMTHWLFLPHSEQKDLRWIDFTARNFARRSSVEFAIQLKHGEGWSVWSDGTRTSNLEPRTSNLEP